MFTCKRVCSGLKKIRQHNTIVFNLCLLWYNYYWANSHCSSIFYATGLVMDESYFGLLTMGTGFYFWPMHNTVLKLSFNYRELPAHDKLSGIITPGSMSLIDCEMYQREECLGLLTRNLY